MNHTYFSLTTKTNPSQSLKIVPLYTCDKWVGKTFAYLIVNFKVVSSGSKTLTQSDTYDANLNVNEWLFIVNKIESFDLACMWFCDNATNTDYLWIPNGDTLYALGDSTVINGITNLIMIYHSDTINQFFAE
jgi:hypothetical protein